MFLKLKKKLTLKDIFSLNYQVLILGPDSLIRKYPSKFFTDFEQVIAHWAGLVECVANRNIVY